jgi:Uma2 family endonuclease
MSTVLKIGPEGHGRPMALEAFMAADSVEGYRYELIDGKLYVSPQPNPPGALCDVWINRKLDHYAEEHPEVINWVCPKARVFVPGREDVTNPEPDAAAYHDFPFEMDFRDIRWEDVSPVLVVEVVSEDDPDKDLVRNVELYHQVPSIKEYWVLDPRDDANRPTLIAHIRHGKRWRVKRVEFGETYTTRLLPGFELLVDPRS